jgi:hypothetical protein
MTNTTAAIDVSDEKAAADFLASWYANSVSGLIVRTVPRNATRRPRCISCDATRMVNADNKRCLRCGGF